MNPKLFTTESQRHGENRKAEKPFAGRAFTAFWPSLCLCDSVVRKVLV